MFGATSIPSIANYALKQTASGSCQPIARDAILRHFYVDDFLACSKTEDEDVELTRNVKSVVATGRFELVSFNSNSLNVLQSLSDSDRNSLRSLVESRWCQRFSKGIGRNSAC